MRTPVPKGVNTMQRKTRNGATPCIAVWLCWCLLFSTVHAADIDSVFEMRSALMNEGLNNQAVKILLRHAKLESEYGTKGVAKKNGWNWWNRTVKKGGQIAYEFEHGKMVKKRWAVYNTCQEAAKSQIRFLRRRYKGALTEASKGNWQGYMRVLRRGGYFGQAKSR